MTTEKARVTDVQIGQLEIEGLMLPDGTFAIAATQVARLISAHPAQASRQLKRALGGESPLNRVPTELNTNPATVVTLTQFSKAMFKLAIGGNEKAAELSEMLQELSLHQLFADAFGQKFDEEDRQQWLKFRQAHKKQFHPKYTFWLKEDNPERTDYGTQVNMLKVRARLAMKPVEEYTEFELDQLNQAEVEYNAYRKIGMSHEEALKAL